MTPERRAELRKLRCDAHKALSPNKNHEGEWKASKGHEGMWYILGPLYKSRPSRDVLATTFVDGFREEADANNQAIAEVLVASYNAVPSLLDSLDSAEAEIERLRSEIERLNANDTFSVDPKRYM